MKVHSRDSGDSKRIIVRLGNPGSGEHSLDVDRARELRDALTRELGEPQALTDREAMVWAVEYVRYLEGDVHDAAAVAIAISCANDAVAALRSAMSGGGQ